MALTKINAFCVFWAFLFGLFPARAVAQSFEAYHMHQCTELTKQATAAGANRQWQKLVDSNQQYLSECTDISTPQRQADSLGGIGMGLIELKRYDDALPALRRCVSLDSDHGGCWLSLGNASESLGKIPEARGYYRKVIDIGSIDTESAICVDAAKKYLSALDHQYPEDAAPGGESSDPTLRTQHSYGTGFFVSKIGHILTNDHVVAGCKSLSTRDGKPVRVVDRSPRRDLALLKADIVPPMVAVFRVGAPPKIGDSVVVFGFPLPGVLSSEGNITTGVLSATSGLQDDVRFVQLTAPVQPGNSGGPLLDSSGHVIGVVVAKLNVLELARITGDVAQNVNFAVHWAGVRAFLEEESVPYQKAVSQRSTSTREVAARAIQMSVALDCSE